MENTLRKALSALEANQSCAFATVIESTAKGTPQKAGAKMVVFEDGSLFGTIGGGINEERAKKECLKAIKTKKTAFLDYSCTEKVALCGGKIKVFIEPFLTKKHLIICGAGHIGLSLSIVAKMLNFKISVIDSRKSLLNPKRFPHADKLLIGSFSKCLSKIPIKKDTIIMIATFDHASDFEALKSVIKSKAGYIGVIASQNKKNAFIKKLKSLKISEQIIKKIHMPSGLDIGAQTPQEIAISIASEMISESNKDFIGSDKFKKH